MRYLLLFCLPLLLATSCADDDLQPRRNETDLEALNRLVPVTQTGAGTFGCLVNGELWIPEVDGASDVAADALVGISNPFNLSITATKEPLSDDRDQLLTIGSVFLIGIESKLKRFSFFNSEDLPGNCAIIEVDTTFVNYILIDEYDTSNQTISGRFECTMQEPDCPSTTIEITEGRFDLKYRF